MKLKLSLIFILLTVVTAGQLTAQENQVLTNDKKLVRTIPEPHPDHPGNVYLAGESVQVSLPQDLPSTVMSWQLEDEQGKILQKGGIPAGNADLHAGQLPVGWYNIRFFDGDKKQLARTTAAVISRLKSPTPLDSPVCVDSATAWFAKNDPQGQEYLSSLAALAGVNWIRDRLTWKEIQPDPYTYADTRTSYDTSAAIQTRYGLQVLQVFHQTPDWAVDKKLDPEGGTGRFPRDLRHAYNFCRHLSKRFKGQVGAWEPWNEANIHVFGGHTIDEMCAMQKAAYLGFKAGDPDVIVGWNAYAGIPIELHAEGIEYNEADAYFDTYNLHSYDWPHSYERLWQPARQAAAGRPIWITECDRGMKYTGPQPWCELTREGEIQKAELIAQEYAHSMFAGSKKHFHFILGHYYETNNGVQFGLLRLDNTPRPAYVALAALGRFLAGGRCLGRLKTDDTNVHIYAFQACPDGLRRDLLIAWVERETDWPGRGKTTARLKLPQSLSILQAFDYLGRDLKGVVPDSVDGKPVYLILPKDNTGLLNLEKPRKDSAQLKKPSPVVMQVQIEQKYSMKYVEKQWSEAYVYHAEPGQNFNIPVWIYNFGDTEAVGRVRVSMIPRGWRITPDTWDVSLEPELRQEFPVVIFIGADENSDSEGWIRFEAEFTNGHRTVLAIRINASR